MKYRNRSYLQTKTQSSELDSIKSSQLIDDFLKLGENKLLDEKHIQLKIEYLKIILKRFKLCFNQSKNSSNSQLLSSNDLDEFKTRLFTNSPTISIQLVSNIIQSHSNMIRLLSLRLILYLNHFNEFFNQFELLNLNSYIIRQLDLDTSNEESAMCIEYIRLVSQLYPDNINETHFFCLTSCIENNQNKLNNFILETLLELICKKPKVACKLRIFNELIYYIVNLSTENEFCIELIIQTFLKVMDDKMCRDLINLNDFFSYLIAPIVDVDYIPPAYGLNANMRSNSNSNSDEIKIEGILNNCFTALNSILNNYSGIFCFCVNDSKNLKTLLSPLSWFLESNKRDSLKQMNFFFGAVNATSFCDASSYFDMKNFDKNDQYILKQLLILNNLIKFLYKLFDIDEINTRDLVEKAKKTYDTSTNYMDDTGSSLDEDFINSECQELFDSIEKYTIQSNTDNLNDDDKLNIYSTSPNLKICFRSFLVKTFAEQNIFESLLDLYFGLPVSFLQSYSLMKYDQNQSSLNSSFQSLSLKCLNLFAELYYLVNELFFNEYFIDDFEGENLPKENSAPYNINFSVYNHMKKFTLITYMKKLNDFEREKEVIIYLTEFNKNKQSIKSGSFLPIDTLAKLSFFSHQFLSNSAFLSSTKYDMELEILNSFKNKSNIQTDEDVIDLDHKTNTSSIFDFVSSLVINEDTSFPFKHFTSSTKEKKKELKKKLTDIYKNLDEQINLTLILQFDSNIFYYDQKQKQQQKQLYNKKQNSSWNWIEIVRLFEIYLLTSSSMHPRFFPTKDSLFLESQNKNNKIFDDNRKLSKLIKKLTEFFMFNTSNESTMSSSPSSSSSLTKTFNKQINNKQSSQNTNLNDLILCVGCYLIDYILNRFDENNINKSIESSKNFSSIEYNLIQLLQSIKLYLVNEYPLNETTNPNNSSGNHNMFDNSARSSFISVSSMYNKNITKDSIISYYILFIGHLTSSEKGDRLLESFKIYDLLIKIIEIYKDLTLMKLIVSTFNYYISFKSRSILKKCLCLAYSSLNNKEQILDYRNFKIYTLKLISNIFKANAIKFDPFFLNTIIKSMLTNEEWSLNSNQSQIVALNINNQMVVEFSINLVEYFINLRPDLIDSLLKLRESTNQRIEALKNLIINDKNLKYLKNGKILKIKLKLLFYRFQLSEANLVNLTKAQFEKLVDEWDESNMDTKYYQLLERYLFEANAVNSYYVDEFDDTNEETDAYFDLDQSDMENFEDTNQNIEQDDYSCSKNYKLYRRINDPNKNHSKYLAQKAQTYLPYHINSSIIKYKPFLDDDFYLSEKFQAKIVKYIEIIKQAATLNNEKSKKLKSALWSISTLCICEDGFKYMSHLNKKFNFCQNLFEFITWFVKIAEDHSSLSIRSTCFYCLNLLSKSCTGANLLGKLGWHTFQPNRLTQPKSLYSTLCSMSYNDYRLYDFGIYSSFNSAIFLYNLNRTKSKVCLKHVNNFYEYDLSNYENEFLDEKMKLDYWSKKDDEFIKIYDTNKIGYLFESICVPIRTSLLAADSIENVTKSTENDREKEGKCNCFYCFLNSNNYSKESESTNCDRKFKFEIVELINQLTPMINIEKKLAKLAKLRQTNPNDFSFCLHNYIFKNFLSKYKIKFYLRNFIQELFRDMNNF